MLWRLTVHPCYVTLCNRMGACYLTCGWYNMYCSDRAGNILQHCCINFGVWLYWPARSLSYEEEDVPESSLLPALPVQHLRRTCSEWPLWFSYIMMSLSTPPTSSFNTMVSLGALSAPSLRVLRTYVHAHNSTQHTHTPMHTHTHTHHAHTSTHTHYAHTHTSTYSKSYPKYSLHTL